MRKTLIFLIFLLNTVHVSAQNNFIGTAPLQPVFGTVSLHYERAVLPRVSAVIGMGRKFNSGVLEIAGLNGERLQSDDISFHGIRLLPEIRWYLSKDDKGLTGFYVGIYYKYQTNLCAFSTTYTPDNAASTEVDLDLKIRTHSAGVEMGYKLFAYKKFYCDFLIAGIGIADSKLDAEVVSEVPEGYFKDLSGEIKRYFLFKGINPEVLTRKKSVEAGFTLPSLRYGINIGIGF